MNYKRKKRLTTDQLVQGILEGDRIILSQAITLVESHLNEDRVLADEMLKKILPHTGNSIRIGITGVPGVGKSTFIEVFGAYITSINKKLAVLAIDPSSKKTGGSILGDKTRMEKLSNDELAFIRPSSSQSALGGVSHRTRETILLCEAAGYEVIMVETVGVGQSEVTVHGMVDFFLLLMLAGAGDELQGIKKGIIEMADAIAITKADGDNYKVAKKAKTEYQNALHLFPLSIEGWQPKVVTCSALKNEGIEEIWEMITAYNEHVQKIGHHQLKRIDQNLEWMHDTIDQTLKFRFYTDVSVKKAISKVEDKVKNGEMTALQAAQKLIADFDRRKTPDPDTSL